MLDARWLQLTSLTFACQRFPELFGAVPSAWVHFRLVLRAARLWATLAWLRANVVFGAPCCVLRAGASFDWIWSGSESYKRRLNLSTAQIRSKFIFWLGNNLAVRSPDLEPHVKSNFTHEHHFRCWLTLLCRPRQCLRDD